jgi:hypothetical protein
MYLVSGEMLQVYYLCPFSIFLQVFGKGSPRDQSVWGNAIQSAGGAGRRVETVWVFLLSDSPGRYPTKCKIVTVYNVYVYIYCIRASTFWSTSDFKSESTNELSIPICKVSSASSSLNLN